MQGLLSDSNLNTDKILPVRIKAQLFHELIENIKLIHDIGKLQEHEKFEEFDDIDSDVDLVKQCNVSYEEWHRTKSNLIRALKNTIGMNCWILQKIEDLNKSDKLTSSSDNFSSFNYISEEAPERMLTVFVDSDNTHLKESQTRSYITQIERENYIELKNKLVKRLPTDNVMLFSQEDDLDTYQFKSTIIDRLKKSIDKSIGDNPLEKGKMKTLPEILQEHTSHLTILREHMLLYQLVDRKYLEFIRKRITFIHSKAESSSRKDPSAKKDSLRNEPIFIKGSQGVGKTTLLYDAYTSCTQWFTCPVTRIARTARATPRSCRVLEFFRVLCQQLSFVLALPQGHLPKDAGFDPRYVSKWFKDIIRCCGERDEVFIIFIDDLHKLLGMNHHEMNMYMPAIYPRNVFVIFTVATNDEPGFNKVGSVLNPSQSEQKLMKSDSLKTDDKTNSPFSTNSNDQGMKISSSEQNLREQNAPLNREQPSQQSIRKRLHKQMSEQEVILSDQQHGLNKSSSEHNINEQLLISKREPGAGDHQHSNIYKSLQSVNNCIELTHSVAIRRCENCLAEYMHKTLVDEEQENLKNSGGSEKSGTTEEKNDKVNDNENCEDITSYLKHYYQPKSHQDHTTSLCCTLKHNSVDDHPNKEDPDNHFKSQQITIKNTTTFSQHLENRLNKLQDMFGMEPVAQFCRYICCTEFGLTESECLELLVPIEKDDSIHDEPIGCRFEEKGEFNFRTFRAVKEAFGELILDKYLTGKIVLQWRHQQMGVIVRRKFLTRDVQKQTHIQVANLFLNEDEPEALDEADDSSQDNPATTTTYNLRHVEEYWTQLLRAGSLDRLKKTCCCNFDFLLASVQMVSISYLRCLLEEIRDFILDRDIEIVYYIIQKSSDTLTRDPTQLAAQMISWLKHVSKGSEGDAKNNVLNQLMTSSMAWSDGFTSPLLVPLNSWLPPPISEHIKHMTVRQSVNLLRITPGSQHLVVACANKSHLELYHIMSNRLVHVFTGHSGPVTCMDITKGSQYLLTGSEDTTVIIWDLKELRLRFRIFEHIAPILSVCCAFDSEVISAGDDSSIIVTSLVDGTTITKIDHHRGPVTALVVDKEQDILLSSSQDTTICIWALTDFELLNCIKMQDSVLSLDISGDNVFLLAHCKDNGLYVRSLVTGTELHKLEDAHSEIQCISIANDNRRAVVGCADGSVLVYELHSGKLLKMYRNKKNYFKSYIHKSHQVIDTSIYVEDRLKDTAYLHMKLHDNKDLDSKTYTSICICESDDFLIVGVGDQVEVYSFRDEGETNINSQCFTKNLKKSMRHRRPRIPNTSSSTSDVTCISDVTRDDQFFAEGDSNGDVTVWSLVTSSVNNVFSYSVDNGKTSGTGKSSSSSDKTIGAEKDKFAIGKSLSGSSDKFVTSLSSSHGGGDSCVTCVTVSPDVTFVTAGFLNGDIISWKITDSSRISIFRGHKAPISCVRVLWDNKKIISGGGKGEELMCTNFDCSLTILSLNASEGDSNHSNSGKSNDVKYCVTHSDVIECFSPSHCGRYVVTGSRDASLKVWQTDGGKLAQVLVGHTDGVTCLSYTITPDTTSSTNSTSVASKPLTTNLKSKYNRLITGSLDCNLILWDVETGSELFLLGGHLAPVRRVDVSGDGSTCVSASDDGTIIVWELKRGLALTSLHLHCTSILNMCVANDCNRIIARLSLDNSISSSYEQSAGIEFSTPAAGRISVICLHNTPAVFRKIEENIFLLGAGAGSDDGGGASNAESEDSVSDKLTGPGLTFNKLKSYGAGLGIHHGGSGTGLSKRKPAPPLRKLLKKEVSLDTYSWQKKYGHLTASSTIMAQVDEKLKRRFSVSASMEEISKLAENNSGSNLDHEGGNGKGKGSKKKDALRKSQQHFDQLEQLWSKVPTAPSSGSRWNRNYLTKQSSLAEDRIDSSDEETDG
ncbi:uncharacterized protein LOC113383572 [Ctenocephalides felis]|uniref:uncharacterized protein LOC113383572 n=1 Tax=Ctenocephalides felis TaxID=7515 RepID=UPI000E6E1222|nr:uncharacterized protein LOC113383572 [Ctenocephalides felis]